MKVSLLCVALVFMITIQLAVSEGDAEDTNKKLVKRRQFLEKKRSKNFGNVNEQPKGQRRRPGAFQRGNEKKPQRDWPQRKERKNSAHPDHKLREKRNAFNDRRRRIRDTTLDVKEILRTNIQESIKINQKRNLKRKARDVKASKKFQDMVIKKAAEKVLVKS